MKRPKLWIGIVVAAVLLALTAAAIGRSRDLGTRFSSGSNRGTFVVARAHGTVTDVRQLFVKVTSRPHLKVEGGYLTDCDKNGIGGTRGNRFKGRTPLVVPAEHRFILPGRCQLTATAQLAGKGRINVSLWVRHAD